MKKNINNVERICRVIGGLGLASMAFWGPSNNWYLLGLVLALTGIAGWCPPYALLGINTCKFHNKTT